MAYFVPPMTGTFVSPAYGLGRATMPWSNYPVFPYQGYPVWNTLYPGQPIPGNMYFKPIWTPKREMKLYRLYVMPPYCLFSSRVPVGSSP